MNDRLKNAKKNRNKLIREDFEKLLNKNIDIKHAVLEVMNKYGLSSGTIWNIIKKTGYYKNE
jgi:hypothetical protein